MKRLYILLLGVVVFCTTAPSFAQVSHESKDTLRILGVGNSWTRDSMRWLSAIAKSAGRPVIVGHGYLGGSFLEDQYHGIDDTKYTYRHHGKKQIVHNTYQYWKYICSENPVKTPSKGYRNGLAGIGVTLKSVVQDEPWDIIIFQPHVIVKAHMPDYCGFDINNLVRRIKSMMKPEVAAAVKCGLMVPFSYPEGNTDIRPDVGKAYNNGVLPVNQEEWNKVYETMHHEIQRDSKRLAAHRGDNCSFVINVGKAIYEARADRELSKFGYKMQRMQSNTHLAEGIPMYVASLCYAYELLGIKPSDISFFPKYSVDTQLNRKGEMVKTKTENSASIAEYARKHVYKSLGLK